MSNFCRALSAVLMSVVLMFGTSCVGLRNGFYAVVPQANPILDAPTPEERAQSKAFYAQYPNRSDEDPSEHKSQHFGGKASLTLADGTVVHERKVRADMESPWLYCRNIEQQAARTSNAWAIEGLVMFGTGLPLTAAGTARVLNAGPDEKKEFRQGWVTLGVGAFLSGLAVFAFERSKAASRAASTATLSMANVTDGEAVINGCLTAKATWVSARETAVDAAKLEMIKHINFGQGRPDAGDSGEISDAGSSVPGFSPAAPGACDAGLIDGGCASY